MFFQVWALVKQVDSQEKRNTQRSYRTTVVWLQYFIGARLIWLKKNGAVIDWIDLPAERKKKNRRCRGKEAEGKKENEKVFQLWINI